jgi:hypothetical protein
MACGLLRTSIEPSLKLHDGYGDSGPSAAIAGSV